MAESGRLCHIALLAESGRLCHLALGAESGRLCHLALWAVSGSQGLVLQTIPPPFSPIMAGSSSSGDAWPQAYRLDVNAMRSYSASRVAELAKEASCLSKEDNALLSVCLSFYEKLV